MTRLTGGVTVIGFNPTLVRVAMRFVWLLHGISTGEWIW